MKKNKKICVVKSDFLSFTSANLENKFVNVMAFRYLWVIPVNITEKLFMNSWHFVKLGF